MQASGRVARVHPDGRLEYEGQELALAAALRRLEQRLPADPQRAWSDLLAELERLGATPQPRLELLRVSLALEAHLEAEEEALRDAVATRLLALELAWHRPPAPVEEEPWTPRGLEPPLDRLVVTSSFGLRRDPIDGRQRYHYGLDLEAPTGTPVRAAASGQVHLAGWAGGHGNRVELVHHEGLVTGYSHLSEVLVRRGEWVAAGQIVGRVGSTGRSTGPHLHFELWRDGEPEDPLFWLQVRSLEIHAVGR